MFNLNLRIFYLDRQYAEATLRGNLGSHGHKVLLLDAKSGYQDLGGIKVGCDLLAQHAIKLKQCTR